ncbi:aminotransferase class V-fold PLP-dependent enzyme [Wenzhouxiangella sp. XN79A]|uniref:aminotransferase class V-fold PLP-dependent enzyme n=1 Tax=Wenzhouxiangella sp. XN79A TaxID=2724193 RepID=UPI00144A725D|nr:aminotransferase class V-fold PLP-dependent enzyme [Wenzhouxiangella sp. XN79A]NKI34546.1 aminotransferase class V-fold PLP-dependent enzyme [Wenzhouxiangella sp. XN79A]
MPIASVFPVIDRHIWLNHAAISPWPAPVADAMRAFVDDNACYGPLHYNDWLEVEAGLRRRARDLLDAECESDIALVKNTSDGLGLIAAGLDWQPGDRLLLLAGEFPSNRLPWYQLTPKEVEVVELPFDPADPEAALIEALDARTRLVAISAVRYDSGIRIDLARLGRACRRHGALLAVDAIQQLGALPLSVRELSVDFVVGGSHKWLLAPEGLALFWSRPEARERLRPVQSGWRMWPDMFDFDRADWSPPADARRFEPGTLNMAGIHGLAAALGVLLETPADERAAALEARVEHLVDGLSGLPDLVLDTPRAARRRAGIVTFSSPRRAPDRLLGDLRRAEVFAARRGPGVRLSPHFYTPIEQLDRALDVVADALARP